MRSKYKETSCIALWIVLTAIFCHQFIWFSSTVLGNSMAPAVKNGELFFSLRIHTFLFPPKRGEIIVVNDGQGLAVKRIIGLPGETIRMQWGSVYVNDQKLEEPYLAPNVSTWGWVKTKRVTLGPGKYFVMGDNRKHSLDSRTYGPISRQQILGKVVLLKI